jgi:hypothetical protein
MNMKSLLSILACVSVAAFSATFGGCGASQEVKINQDWAEPLTSLDPPAPNRNRVYVQYRDASGGDLQLRDDIRGAVANAGYVLVQNPDQADYRLETIIRKFGLHETEAEEALADRSSGLMDVVLDPFTKRKRYTMVIDVVLSQRFQGGVEYAADNTSSGLSESAINSRIGDLRVGGKQSDEAVVSQRVQVRKEHLGFKNQLMLETSRAGMSESDAIEQLRPRITRAIANALSPNT